MLYGIIFELFALVLCALAISQGGWAWLALWPSASCLLVGVAYYINRPAVFGKRIDGTVRTANSIVLLPFLLYLRGIWNLLRKFSREDQFNQLLDKVIIGRRPLAREVAENVTVILDLTCEFSASLPQRQSLRYANFPILDAAAPANDDLPRLLILLESIPVNDLLYIHCANGHGRTALVASILLLIRGAAPDWQSAYQLAKQCRPECRLSSCQRKALKLAAEILRSR